MAGRKGSPNRPDDPGGSGGHDVQKALEEMSGGQFRPGSPGAQSAERVTVNHHVAGSIPARGAIFSSNQDSLRASTFRYAREISFDTPPPQVLRPPDREGF